MNKHSESFRVGLAQTDITPPAGVYLAGFAARTEPSTGVYLPLRAVAVAIDDGTTPVLILSAEWLGFYDQTDAMRDRLTTAIGLPAEQIVLSGTHTHCGPIMRLKDAIQFGPLDKAYLNRAMDAMAEAARQAWEARSPAHLRFGTGHCDLAKCRRKPDGKGGVLRAMTPYPDGASDHDVPVVRIESPEGELRGVLFSYACHPTSRGGLLIGGDYVGFAYDYLDQQYPGVTSCFLQGCAGDQKPRPVDPDAQTFGQREVEQVREIGNEFGEAVKATLEHGRFDPIDGPTATTQQILALETDLTPRTELERSLDHATPEVREWARDQLARIDRGEPASREVPFEVQTIRFGDSLVIITMAAEMSVEHGLRLKRELRPHIRNVLPLAYTNHIIGYVPVERQYAEGGYEVLAANQLWHRTGKYRPETEAQIHTAIHNALDLADPAGIGDNAQAR